MPKSSAVPYNPLTDVDPSTGGGGNPISARATSDSFGGQIGEAMQRAGAQGAKSVDQMSQMVGQVTEAKANSTLANEWYPASAKLRGEFDDLRGQDKIKGYDNYISGLNETRAKLMENASSDYEKNIVGNFTSKQIAQDMEVARREQVTAIHSFEDESHANILLGQAGHAARNYNDPAVVDQTFKQMDGMVAKHGYDRGLNEDQIKEQQGVVRGAAVTSMVGRAVSSGDVDTATKIYDEHKTIIPGYQQLAIESTLHGESVKQTSRRNTDALLNGAPLPEPVASAPRQVQYAVASAAQTVGIDANHALTVARIESSYGQNVGKRGDIGQTGKGGDIHEQSHNMATELKKSQDVAEAALGRSPQGWESYACYQQGAGGGPALLKAAVADPTARAVDVLAPLYKNPKTALQAITNNGGNATMTAGQFLDLIKSKYDSNAKRAMCEVPKALMSSQSMGIDAPGAANQSAPTAQTILGQTPAPTIADAIEKTGNGQGVPIQPAATPQQSLNNFDQVYSDAMARAQMIPNIEERAGTIQALNAKRSQYTAAATAYTGQLQTRAQQLAADPKFTSIDTVPPDLMSALRQDSPTTVHYLQERAEYNLMHASGAATKDEREYGSGFYDAFKAVHADASDPGRITSVAQLQGMVGKDGTITMSGYDKLVKELQGKNTPDGDAEGLMKKQFFANAKAQISGANEGLGIKDPKGDELYLRFMAQALPAYENGKGQGKTAAQLLNPESPDYVGKSIPTFKRPMNQWMADMIQDGSGGMSDAGEISTPQALVAAVQSGKMSRPDGEALALKNGWIRKAAPVQNGPSVPMSE